nr:hypothetical protein [Actinomycetota bacterium]
MKTFNRALRRKVVLAGAAIGALGTAAVASAAISPAGADTVGTPDPVVLATVVGTGQTNVAPTGPLVGLVEGSKVHVHVNVPAGMSGSIFEVKARLCKPGVVIKSSAGFSPTQTGNCVPAPFSLGTDDDYVDTPVDSPFTAADFDF